MRRERYVDVQTVQDHVDACFQASLAGIDLAKCRKPGVPLARESSRNRGRWKKGERVVKDRWERERGKDEDEKDGKEEDGRRMEEGASSWGYHLG